MAGIEVVAHLDVLIRHGPAVFVEELEAWPFLLEVFGVHFAGHNAADQLSVGIRDAVHGHGHELFCAQERAEDTHGWMVPAVGSLCFLAGAEVEAATRFDRDVLDQVQSQFSQLIDVLGLVDVYDQRIHVCLGHGATSTRLADLGRFLRLLARGAFHLQVGGGLKWN